MKAEVELYNFAYNSMICKVANNTDTLQEKEKKNITFEFSYILYLIRIHNNKAYFT